LGCEAEGDGGAGERGGEAQPRVWGLGFRVWNVGLSVLDVGFRV